MRILRDTTLIVKTGLRPKSLTRFLDSLGHFYPELPVIIGDDSDPTRHTTTTEVTDHKRVVLLPYDVGVSRGRNTLLDFVETPYVISVDDDFEFFSETRLERLLACVEQLDYDLVAGWLIIARSNELFTQGLGHVQRFQGLFSIVERGKERVLECTAGQYSANDLKDDEGAFRCYKVDLTLQFFLARTEKLRHLRWDDKLVFCEHLDLFLRAKQQGLQVAVCPNVLALHYRDRPSGYWNYVERMAHSQIQFLAKHNLQTLSFVPFPQIPHYWQ